MSQTFHPVWASELEVFVKGGVCNKLSPVLTRGRKHARGNPADDGVRPDAGRGKAKLRSPATVGELPSE